VCWLGNICRPRIDIADCDCFHSGPPAGGMPAPVEIMISNARSLIPDDAIEWYQPDRHIVRDSNHPFGGLKIPLNLFNVFRIEGAVQSPTP